MIVYLITNLINDKKYVVITKRLLKVRWYEHVKKSKQKNLSDISLHKDIFLYSKENFKVEVLKECSNISEMCLYEKKYILEFNTLNDGYNLNSGGAAGYILWELYKKI